jgi:phosphate starvation-inducible PhoH-like protein
MEKTMSRKRYAKTLSKKDQDIKFLTEVLNNNGMAMTEQRKRKSWTRHDLKAIKPLNEPQRAMFQSYFEGTTAIIANGSAGTGKTLAALYLALTDVLDRQQPQERIIIVRSAVATRDIGHLPGDINEKLEPYEAPYKDIIGFLLGNYDAYDQMKEAGIIEFMPTSFIRGLNWDDAIVIVDEIQNLNFHEANSVITRVGDNTRLIIVGDQIQTDLYRSNNDKSGMDRFLRIARTMKDFDEIVFTKEDIIRSAFVKSWICALEEAS